MSPALTSAPMKAMPASSSFASAASPSSGFGGDLLGPELGVAGHAGQSSMWIVVKRPPGPPAPRSDRSSKLYAVPRHERDSRFWPSARSPRSVEGRRASTSPRAIAVTGLHQRALVDAGSGSSACTGDVVDVHAASPAVVSASLTRTTMPERPRIDHAAAARDHVTPESIATGRSCRAHQRVSERSVGTACACMFEPSARGGVVVLEERDQRGGHRHDLLRRHVHVLDLVGARA